MEGRGYGMELEQLLRLIEAVSQSALTEFRYEEKGVRIRMGKAGTNLGITEDSGILDAGVVTSESGHQNRKTQEKAEEAGMQDEGRVIVSPLVGTFYAAPSEEAKAFVTVGDRVKKGKVLAIIEAMKLMNEIESDCDGVVEQIFVKNGEAVEYGQPLFRIR